ncbi:MAG: hypothetical protein ACHP9Y_01180, partial [Gammaproteobacteria bacterium]
MKNPLIAIKSQFGEVKGRTILIVVVVVVILIIASFFIFRSSEHALISAGGGAKTSTLRAPEIQSMPGFNKANDQAYNELQRQANVQHAQEAISKGESAVATVTGDQFVNELSFPEPGIASIGGQPEKQQPKTNEQALADYQKIYQEQLQREKMLEAKRIREEELQQQEVYQEAFEGLMQNQAKGLLSQWGTGVSQTYVRGPETTPEEGGGGGGAG